MTKAERANEELVIKHGFRKYQKEVDLLRAQTGFAFMSNSNFNLLAQKYLEMREPSLQVRMRLIMGDRMLQLNGVTTFER